MGKEIAFCCISSSLHVREPGSEIPLRSLKSVYLGDTRECSSRKFFEDFFFFFQLSIMKFDMKLCVLCEWL